MATTLLILGEGGTGKSTSLENLPYTTTTVFSPNGKSLPFQGSKKKYVEGDNHFTTSSLVKLLALLKALPKQRPNTEYVVIDDFTHYQNSRMMDPGFISNQGFSKWNQFGADLFAIIKEATELFPPSIKGVVLINHTQTNDRGLSTFKSSGKLVEQTLDFPSYFTYIFHSLVIAKDDGNDYKFLTNNDGEHLAKSPKGCFKEKFVDNDVMEIFNAIQDYENQDSEISEAVQSVSA